MEFFVLLVMLLKIFEVRCMMEPTETYANSETISSGDFVVYWKTNENNITFEVIANTTGWLGIGLSTNGGMPGSDIIVGWVKDGEAKITDRHGDEENGVPPADPGQDVSLIDGKECDGWTMIKFTRQLAACEEAVDKEINGDTVRLIWAYGREDPIGDDLDAVDQHLTANRGTKSVWLLQPENAPKDDLPEGPVYKTMEFLKDGFNVSPKDTEYSCRYYEMPALDKKYHIVKLEPIVQKGNELHVHHFIVSSCTEYEVSEVNIGDDVDCDMDCHDVIYAWAVGGGAVVLPDEAGVSIGDEGDSRFILLNIHYDNPELRSDIVDSSGVRLTYTDTLRQHDSGVFAVGHFVNPTEHFIPPGAESFLSVGVCSGDCIEKRMAERQLQSITMFNAFLHTHLTGISAKLRHIRDGNELPYIASDDAYDFDYQVQRYIGRVELKPKDTIHMNCVYNTMNRKGVTQAGQSTRDEMCLGYISYFPKMDLGICTSSATWKELWPYFGIEVTDNMTQPTGKLQDNNVTFGNGQSGTALDAVMQFNWTKDKIDKFSKDYQAMTQRFRCGNNVKPDETFAKTPEIEREYTPSKKTCKEPAADLQFTKHATTCGGNVALCSESVVIGFLLFVFCCNVNM